MLLSSVIMSFFIHENQWFCMRKIETERCLMELWPQLGREQLIRQTPTTIDNLNRGWVADKLRFHIATLQTRTSFQISHLISTKK